MTHDYKRHGTTTLFAALNTLGESSFSRVFAEFARAKLAECVHEALVNEYGVDWPHQP